MARDKITEYSSTASENTVVGDVNLAENSMNPSDVNNALREVLSHQKEAFGSGTPLYVDQTNNRVGVNKTPTVALDVSGGVTYTGDLASSTSGTSNFRAGVNAGNTIASGGNYNTVVGDEAGTAISTGDANVAMGYQALATEDAHGTNSAIGYQSLKTLNAGADSHNTAVGYISGVSITSGIQNTIVGSGVGDALTDADFNVAMGYQSLTTDTKGNRTTAIGFESLKTQNFTSSTDSNNTAVGNRSGALVTTGVNNTLIGSFAGDGIDAGGNNTAVGKGALGGSVGNGNYNTCIGSDAGLVTTGSQNCFVGGYDPSTGGSGELVTTGSKNTILGSYNGNQSGIDIRTTNNNIVLSDGDGVVKAHFRPNGNANFFNAQNNAYSIQVVNSSTGTQPYGNRILYSNIARDNHDGAFIECTDSSALRFRVLNDGDVQNHDNSYGAISDVKLKEQITDASSQWNDIKALTVRKYKMKEDVAKGDSDAHWRLGVVAQEVESAGMSGLVSTDVDKDSTTLEDLGTTTKAVKYSILYMKAVKALQEAMTRIETLEAKVTALEG